MSDENNESFASLFIAHPGAVVLGWLIGVCIALAGLGLLLWEEQYAISSTRALEEGSGKVVEIAAEPIDPSHEGKLVHVSGPLVTEDKLTDTDFGVTVAGIRLFRHVEMFQWKEHKKKKTSGDNKVETITYTREWSSDKPKTDFAQAQEPANPEALPFPDQEFTATSVRLGAFSLSPAQIKAVKGTQPWKLTPEILDQRPADPQSRGTLDEEGKLFVSMTPGSTPQAPVVGDVRVSYELIPAQEVTIVARQSGQSLTPFQTSAGTEIDILEVGKLDAKAAFASAHEGSRIVYWALRILLMMLLSMAFFLMVRPTAQDSGWDMMRLTNNVAFLAFGVAAAVFSVLAVVGIRWLLSHPVFAVQCLGIGLVGLGILLLILRRYDRSGLFTPLARLTPESRELYRQVALDPRNLALRHQLADSLGKSSTHGQFMKTCLELEAIDEQDPRHKPLSDCWSELYNKDCRLWFLGLSKLRLWPQIGNTFAPYLWLNLGVIEKVEIRDPKVLPRNADRLFQAAPGLHEIEFQTSRYQKGNWVEIADQFDFPGIFALPHLEQVGTLDMHSARVSLETLKALANSSTLKNLKQLNVSSNSLGKDGATVLASSSGLPQLADLDLSSCSLDDAAVSALASWKRLAKLTRLNLGYNSFTREGLRDLFAPGQLTELKELILNGNELGPEGAGVLASATQLQNLAELDLESTGLGRPGLQTLANASQFASVKVLNLSSNEIDAEGLKSVLNSPLFSKVEALTLSDNPLGDAGLEALSRWPGLSHVKTLVIRSSSVTAVGIRALASSPHVSALEELDLSGSAAGVNGARAIVASETLTKLKSLKLNYSEVTEEGSKLLEVRFGKNVECY